MRVHEWALWAKTRVGAGAASPVRTLPIPASLPDTCKVPTVRCGWCWQPSLFQLVGFKTAHHYHHQSRWRCAICCKCPAAATQTAALHDPHALQWEMYAANFSGRERGWGVHYLGTCISSARYTAGPWKTESICRMSRFTRSVLSLVKSKEDGKPEVSGGTGLLDGYLCINQFPIFYPILRRTIRTDIRSSQWVVLCSRKTRLHSRTVTRDNNQLQHQHRHRHTHWHTYIRTNIRSSSYQTLPTQDYLRVLFHRPATPPADISSSQDEEGSSSCAQLQPEVAQAMTNRHALLRPSWPL